MTHFIQIATQDQTIKSKNSGLFLYNQPFSLIIKTMVLRQYIIIQKIRVDYFNSYNRIISAKKYFDYIFRYSKFSKKAWNSSCTSIPLPKRVLAASDSTYCFNIFLADSSQLILELFIISSNRFCSNESVPK